MTMLLVAGVLGLIVGIVVWKQNRVPTGDRDMEKIGRLAIPISIAVIVISIIAGTFTTVPAGHRGVVIRFSAITGTILAEGLQTKLPFIDSVIIMSVQTQKYEVSVTSASHDLQDVATTIALNWHLDPSMTDDIYRTIGLEFIERLAAPAVQETVKQVTARYNAEDLILQRDSVKADIEADLTNRLFVRGIVVETISITDFSFSATFTAAIEAKVSAEQAVLEATNKLEQVKVEAQQAEEQAIGEANARIAEAEGEAEYIRIVTEAQVAANNAISGSLSAEVLQYILLDRVGDDITIMVIPGGESLSLVIPDSSG